MLRRTQLVEAVQAGLLDSGLEPDLADAILSSAEECNAPAQFIVASAVEVSFGFEESLEWYRRSASQGYRPARERLRRLHRNAA